MNLTTFSRNVRNVGPLKALADIVLRALNRFFVLKILKIIRIDVVDPAFLEWDDDQYQGRFLDADMLWKFALNPENELPPDFLNAALDKGDECYGFLTGTSLAAYTWYARRPTGIDVPGLELQFADDDVYVYKGYTAGQYRGQRLLTVGMTRGLAAFQARGYRGLVAYVEWNNFGSLRACFRMGYRHVGNIVIIGGNGDYFLHHTGFCDNGLTLRRTTAPTSPPSSSTAQSRTQDLG